MKTKKHISKLFGLFRRDRRSAELDDEIRAHLEMEENENRAAGMAPQAARDAARRAFGNVMLTQEDSRNMWRFLSLEQLLQDVRFALRMLRKNPGFAAVAVATLALGIGANTAIFSVVNAVLLRPLPYSDPARLVRVKEAHPDSIVGNFTYGAFGDLLRHPQNALGEIAAYRFWTFNVRGAGEPEQVPGASVSASFFPLFGVPARLGRGFLPDEDQPGKENVVVLSYGLWQRRFGGDKEIIGKTIRVSDVLHLVVGVMPPGFNYPGQSELWTPLVAGGPFKDNRRSHLLRIQARLLPGVTLQQAQSQLAAFAREENELYSDVDPQFGVRLESLKEEIVGPVRPALLVLLGAVGFVVLVACANVANLLLMRNSSRHREFAIRAVLGASPRRLARQFLVESALLGVSGGVAGVLLAAWCLRSIIALSSGDIPRLDQASLDGRVLWFSFGVSLLAALLFGAVPALEAARSAPQESLKETGRGTPGKRSLRLRGFLVVSETALALILLTGAGLLMNSFARLAGVDPGFDEKNLLALNLFLSESRYSQSQIAPFLQQVAERIRALPGVVSAGVVSLIPVTLGPDTDFEIEGRPVPVVGEEPDADIRIADPGYLATMKIPLVRGRWFTAQDSATSPKVMVISASLARRYFANENPLGKHITMKDWGPPLKGEIVGVVGDVKSEALDAQDRPMIYWPCTQFPSIFDSVVVRTTSDPLQLAAAVKSTVWAVDPDEPVAQMDSMEHLLAGSVAERKFQMVLLGLFAFLALALAAVGIYGVMGYTVSCRTHEIGIRVALGATRGELLRLVVGEGMTLTFSGIGLGLAGAFGMTRFLSGMLYGVRPGDPATFAAVACVIALVAALACYVPARRAMKVDPMVALRYE